MASASSRGRAAAASRARARRRPARREAPPSPSLAAMTMNRSYRDSKRRSWRSGLCTRSKKRSLASSARRASRAPPTRDHRAARRVAAAASTAPWRTPRARGPERASPSPDDPPDVERVRLATTDVFFSDTSVEVARRGRASVSFSFLLRRRRRRFLLGSLSCRQMARAVAPLPLPSRRARAPPSPRRAGTPPARRSAPARAPRGGARMTAAAPPPTPEPRRTRHPYAFPPPRGASLSRSRGASRVSAFEVFGFVSSPEERGKIARLVFFFSSVSRGSPRRRRTPTSTTPTRAPSAAVARVRASTRIARDGPRSEAEQLVRGDVVERRACFVFRFFLTKRSRGGGHEHRRAPPERAATRPPGKRSFAAATSTSRGEPFGGATEVGRRGLHRGELRRSTRTRRPTRAAAPPNAVAAVNAGAGVIAGAGGGTGGIGGAGGAGDIGGGITGAGCGTAAGSGERTGGGLPRLRSSGRRRGAVANARGRRGRGGFSRVWRERRPRDPRTARRRARARGPPPRRPRPGRRTRRHPAGRTGSRWPASQVVIAATRDARRALGRRTRRSWFQRQEKVSVEPEKTMFECQPFQQATAA